MIFVDPTTTNARTCLKLAARVNVALKQALGQGIDVQRMVDEPLYARDVLLVCDALRQHQAGGTSALAQQFRQAKRGVAPPAAAGSTRDTRQGIGGSSGFGGFSASRFLSSIFGSSSARDGDADAAAAADSRRHGAGTPSRQPADIGR